MPYSWSFALTSCSLILGLVGTLTEEDMMEEVAVVVTGYYGITRERRLRDVAVKSTGSRVVRNWEGYND